MTTLDQDEAVLLKPCIGDRIVYAGPVAENMHPDNVLVWDRRRTAPSLVIDVAGGWAHSVELHSGSYEPWSGRVEDVRVIGRATYSDSARERAFRHVQALSENAALHAQVATLTEERVEQEYRLELAEEVVRTMQDLYPPRVYLPGAAEPARAEPIGESRIVIRNAVFAVGSGFVYRQMHEDEWYAAHLASSVFSWEQVLGDGPCIEVTNPAGVGRLFDVLAEHRHYERELKSILWALERDLDTIAREHAWMGDVGRDQERAGSIEEARAVVARAERIIYKLSAAYRRPL